MSNNERPSWTAALTTCSEELQSNWIEMRRHLHRHPELSGAELLTTRYLATELGKLDLPVHVSGENCGLTADLITSPKVATGPRLAIRGDIDALPITDAKTVAYRSTNEGVMHACGHDVHATIVIGAMQILAAMNRRGELPWPVAVRSILQPAEETSTGARHMIHHHALRDVTAILALHVDPTRKVGCIGLRSGVLTAAADMFSVQFNGRGGHGARPHLTKDPIDACTHWVQSAFRRVTRSIDPHKIVTISVGQIEAGHSPNVIPDTALLSGTLRSLDAESRRIALETLEDICEAIAKETGCEVDMRLGVSAPGVINDPDLTQLLADSVVQTLDPGSVDPIEQPSMGSEDFSFYLEHVPGAMFRLGVAGDQVGSAPLHTSVFDVDERSMLIGAKLFAAAAIKFFDPSRTNGAS